MVFTAAELSRLQDMNTHLSRYLIPGIKSWFELNRRVPFLPWKGGFIPWDVLATSLVIIPEAFSDMQVMHLDVKPRGPARGRVFVDRSGNTPSTHVPKDVDPERVLESLLDSLGSFA